MRKLVSYLFRTILLLFVIVNVITAFHAYKFTHFYDADQSVIVKPQNKKTGLEVTKDVLFGFKSYKRPDNIITDSSLQVVNLTTNDQINIEGWYIPTALSHKGTVILFHGHGSHKQAILDEAAAFRKMGYHTFLIDFRAHGNSGGNTCTIGYKEGEEVKLAYNFIKEKNEGRVILWGISMGAAAITSAMHSYPEIKPAKIILEMPYGTLLEAAEGRIRIMGIPAEPLASLVTFWGGVEHGFWAFNMKPELYAKDITEPVLLQWGANDPRVSAGEINQLYKNLQGPKKLVVYQNSKHESLCKNEHVKWTSEMQNFLNQ